jgi:hypothetical protein
MRQGPARILAVTAGLCAGGAVFGALAGAVAVTVVMMGLLREFDWSLPLLAARMGAPLGAVLLPTAGWTVLRRVPLWRAVTGTFVGTVIGGILGVALGFFAWPIGVMVAPPCFAILGFLGAAIWLRRRFPVVREAERIQVPHGAGVRD